MGERFPEWVSTRDPSRIEYWHVHDVDGMTPEEALPLIEAEVLSLMRRLYKETLASIGRIGRDDEIRK
jgi:hypothetical protein